MRAKANELPPWINFTVHPANFDTPREIPPMKKIILSALTARLSLIACTSAHAADCPVGSVKYLLALSIDSPEDRYKHENTNALICSLSELNSESAYQQLVLNVRKKFHIHSNFTILNAIRLEK
jgi:hypothetical protein